jgi:hypothetical protein
MIDVESTLTILGPADCRPAGGRPSTHAIIVVDGTGCHARRCNAHDDDKGTSMGIFDRMKDRAEGLVDAAKDKVSDVTGVDTDKLIDAAHSVADAAESLTEAKDSLTEGRLNP